MNLYNEITGSILIIFKIIFLLSFILLVNQINKCNNNLLKTKLRNKILNLEINNKYKLKDFNYILNYRGSAIEPEWEWVKNISFVYTWVDGSDINLSYIKSKYNGGERKATSRDRSADELLYSLRSLKKYLPWHMGTIFIITDNQIPKWLNIDNKKIKIINHEEIIPKYINPTFDSSTIECFLDKIPGIGEIFIYLNDDFFFNNFVHPAFFFTSETFYPKIFRSNEEIINKTLVKKLIEENNIHYIYRASVYFTYKIIKEHFDNNFTYYHLAHSAYICYKSLFEPFRNYFYEELKVVFSHRFRCAYKPVTLYLYQMLLLYANGNLPFNSTDYYKNKLYEFRNKYLLGNSSLINYTFEIIPEKITRLFVKFSSVNDVSKSNYNNFNYFMNNNNILIYNINDKYNSSQSLYEFTQYMMIRYPESNIFEKENYVNLEKKYYNKLQFVNEINIDNKDYYNKDKEDNIFHKLFFNRKNLEIIKEYLEEKNKLYMTKNISSEEQEEIELLENYDGGELEKEWYWVKDISIVYIISENDCKTINELKYSLRSIQTYLPWFVGKIFIILQINDCNISWLNLKGKNIKIINPKEIISKKFHNFYSKHLIEMYLDKIPLISERFLLLKHYHFFNNYIHPRFFFSKDFYPKYNLSPKIDDNSDNLKNMPESFLKTYEVIKFFFGANYINNYRLIIDAPISLYRDLFRPVRKLYYPKIVESFNEGVSLLPLYLVCMYNIYATSQIYFPQYVAGFGKIRDSPPPSIKQSTKISYYGFDITSEIILDKSIRNINLSKNIEKKLNRIMKTNILLLSIDITNISNMNILISLRKFLEQIYNIKSIFEL